MTFEEALKLKEQLRAMGLVDEEILEGFYKLYDEEKISLFALSDLVKKLGYELSEEFINDNITFKDKIEQLYCIFLAKKERKEEDIVANTFAKDFQEHGYTNTFYKQYKDRGYNEKYLNNPRYNKKIIEILKIQNFEFVAEFIITLYRYISHWSDEVDFEPYRDVFVFGLKKLLDEKDLSKFDLIYRESKIDVNIDEAKRMITELKEEGLPDEAIVAGFYQLFIDEKITLSDLEYLMNQLGWELTDEFKKLSPEDQKTKGWEIEE